MQKVLRRNLLARNQDIRATRKHDKKLMKKDRHESMKQRIWRNSALTDDVKTERRHRREDWILGPLAPDRNIGENKGSYGTFNRLAARLPTIVERDREKYVPFAPGDRVVVVRGRHRGKIAAIKEVDEERGSVELDGINVADIDMPSFARELDGRRHKPTIPFTLPIALADVRLVIPMKDESTGRVSDVVVRHLRCGEPFIEREYGSSTPKHTRYIEGMDMEIPWPDATISEAKTEDSDTLRLTVEEKTFVPSWNAPMPATVIDELRNKFDRMRARHDKEFVEKKMKEDAKEAWMKRRRLLTPQTEYWEAKRKEKDAAGKPEVTSETLKLIQQMQALKITAHNTATSVL